MVDETYQRIGIATFLYGMMIRLAKERGIRGFVADVLFTNTAMIRVFEKHGVMTESHLEGGVYSLVIHFPEE
jgi:ribosomal protein S18 acetylase RimI-like enzyme